MKQRRDDTTCPRGLRRVRADTDGATIGAFNFVRILEILLALLVGLTVHEASHALIADRLGDPTAKRLGRVTLNPIAHLDPTGTLLMVISALAGFGIGWGKPCPVNPYNLRPGPKVGMALVAAAGPVSNLITATIVVGVLLSRVALPGALGSFLETLIAVNVALAFFNLIPIPPLDGFSVLLGILPNSLAFSLDGLRQYGAPLLLLLVFFGQGFLGAYLRFAESIYSNFIIGAYALAGFA